ncbi:MAG: DUF11 domain-containing protein, partial [bacterium]|nr:DUF11 domain-containing protein [bacterium]
AVAGNDVGTVDVSVNNDTDLAVAKIVDDATPDEGQAIQYTITVTNNGPAQATNIALTDLLPAGLTLIDDGGLTSPLPSQGTYNTGTGLWTVGTVDDGAGATLLLRATVDPGTATTTLTNVTSGLTADQTDSTPGNDVGTVDITVNNDADLDVTKIVDDATPDESGTIQYTITVANNGPAQATNVALTDLLPAGLTLVDDGGLTSPLPSQGSFNTGTGLWTVGTIDDGANATLALRATVDVGTSGDTLTNATSGLTADQTDTVPGNNVGTVDVTVNNDADLAATKIVDDATPDEGQAIQYTITVGNSGPARATGVSVTDLLPAGLTLIDDGGTTSPIASQGTYDTGSGLWTVGSIDNGANVTLVLRATVDSGTSGDTLTNATSGLTADQADPTPANDVGTVDITVNNEVDLAVTKIVDNAAPIENDAIAYTVAIANNGPAQATGVQLTDLLPAGVTLIDDGGATSPLPSQGSYDTGFGVWTIGTIDDAANATLVLRATVDPGTGGTTITNTTSGLAADQVDSIAGNDVGTVDVVVGNQADLAVGKTLDDTSPLMGQTIQYTIAITNSGPTQANNVSVTDALPAGVTSTATPPAASQGSFDGGTGVWTVGTLADGASATLVLEVTVDRGASALPQPIVNSTSGLTSDQTDPDSSNDVGSVGFSIIGVDGTVNITEFSIPGDSLTVTLDDSDLDVDIAVAESIVLRVVNDVTGEQEDLTLTETGPSTGVFSATLGTAFGTSAGINDDGTMNTQAGDTVTAVYNDVLTSTGGGSTAPVTDTDTVLGGIDGTITLPATVAPGETFTISVDDSDLNTDSGAVETVDVDIVNDRTGETETITLTETGAATGAFSGTVDTVLGSVPGAGGDDTLVVRPADTLTASYDDAFTSTGGPDTFMASTVVVGDIVRLVKSADDSNAVVGTLVGYSVLATNTTAAPLTGVVLSDDPPSGFKYVADTARLVRAGGDGELGTSDDVVVPLASSGVRPVEFGPLDMAANETVEVRYLLRVGSGALPGIHTNRVTPELSSFPVGQTATANVEVRLDPVFDESFIIGKVFLDHDRDDQQDPGERGVPNAMVVLDNGTYALTDEYGRYHIPAVKPGQRMVKINLNTLPPGAEAATDKFHVLWVTPGLMAKANFGVILRHDTASIGRPGSPGVAVTTVGEELPLAIQGNTETMSVLLNGENFLLPSSDVLVRFEDLEESITLRGQSLTEPVSFDLRLDDAEAQSWKLTITDPAGNAIRTLEGKGSPTQSVEWDGLDSSGATVLSGEIYHYQIEVVARDGSVSSSPRRLFGVNRKSAVSIELTGDAFESGKDKLSSTARKSLREAAEILRDHPGEKVLIEGHTDWIGDDGYNLDLSRRRAQAAASFLISKEKLSEDRFVLGWFGEQRPIAPNTLAEGRALNRRVEVRGEVEETERTNILDVYRGTPQVRINGSDVPVEEHGRFRTQVDDTELEDLHIEMQSSEGRLANASVPIPALAIEGAAGRFTVPFGKSANGCNVPAAESASDAVSCRFAGRTDPGNVVELEGRPVAVDEEGRFVLDLGGAHGKNTFGLLVRNPQGFARLANLAIDVEDRDAHGRAIVVSDAIPNLTVNLPPEGMKLKTSVLLLTGVVDPGSRVEANGDALEVQPDGRFAGTVELPIGTSPLHVKVVDSQGKTGEIERRIEVAKHQLFFLAFADGKVGSLESKGFVEGTGLDEDDTDEFFAEGRLAFYLKGVIAGKYLITSAFDNKKDEAEYLFRDLDYDNSQRLLANLDPERYYPVYGDDSTVVHDAQSQGEFYLALDSETIHALFGNYTLNMTENELSAYRRTLYGGRFQYQSLSKTKYGRADTEVMVFGSELEQAHISDELRATGGSLYYLSHQDVIEGSEQVTLVVRDKVTNLIHTRIPQRQNIDYTVRYPEGRIMFNRPVSSVIEGGSLVDQDLLGGQPIYVQVDYETLLESFDETAAGARVRQQIGDHVSVGGTYINDEQPSGEYELSGVDAEVRLGQNTRLTAEFADSSGSDSRTFYSDDGGLTYTDETPTTMREGTAWKAAAELDVGEWFGNPDRYRVRMYYKDLESGFFSNGNFQERGTKKYGFDANLDVTLRDSITVRHDEEENTETTASSVQYQHKRERWGFRVEYFDTESEAGALRDNSYGAARFWTHITDKFSTRVEHQHTIDGTDNDQTTVGVQYQVHDSVALELSGTEGTLGSSAQAGAILTFGKSNIYLNERVTDSGAGRKNTTVVGTKAALGETSQVYSEYQRETGDGGDRAISLLGLQRQWDVAPGVRLLLSGETAQVTSDSEDNDRSAFAAQVAYQRPDGTLLSSRNEIRYQDGDTDQVQFVSFTKFDLKLNPDFTLQAKYHYSKTKDRDTEETDARLEERSLGLAYRPVAHDRFNAIARYTRLFDQRPLSLAGFERTDRRMDVVSLETSIQVMRRLEWVTKSAARFEVESVGELSSIDSDTILAIQRLNVDVWRPFDLGVEYRILAQDQSDDQREGFLAEFGWSFKRHVRFGLGYNFTDFSDNEFSQNDYSVQGWFIRVQGMY